MLGGCPGQLKNSVGGRGFTVIVAEDREHPREVVLRACAEHGQDAVIDWCIAFLTGEISGEAAYGAELPKLVAITGSANPGGWKAPVDPVNYYWIRVWAARVFLYVWRDDVIDALLVAANDPAWMVREHVARITAQRELGQLAMTGNAVISGEPMHRRRLPVAHVAKWTGRACGSPPGGRGLGMVPAGP